MWDYHDLYRYTMPVERKNNAVNAAHGKFRKIGNNITHLLIFTSSGRVDNRDMEVALTSQEYDFFLPQNRSISYWKSVKIRHRHALACMESVKG